MTFYPGLIDPNITDEELKALGWDGVIASLEQALEMANIDMDVAMDALAEHTVHGMDLNSDQVLALLKFQTQAVQTVETRATMTAHLNVMRSIWGFMTEAKARLAAETAAQEA